MKIILALLFSILLLIGEFILLGQCIINSPQNIESLFLIEVLGKNLVIPRLVIISISVLTIFLLFYLSKYLFSLKVAVLTVFLYVLSPWVIYVGYSGDIAILWMFLILFQIIGFLKRDDKIGLSIFYLMTILVFISSLFLWPWDLAILFYFSQKVELKKRILDLGITSSFLLLIGALSLIHLNELKYILYTQIPAFSNVGLINTINQFQGETRANHLFFLGRFVENKYVYVTTHLFSNILSAFSPVTYFSPQYKLLNFSFSPPIFVAFLIPFLYQLVTQFDLILNKIKLLPLLVALLIPASLVQNSPDLNNLIIIMPVILIFITLGIEKLINQRDLVAKLLLVIMIGLFLFQAIVVVADIQNRDPIRLERVRASN